MLNNHLTSIQNVSKLILLVSLVCSCTSGPVVNKNQPKIADYSTCKNDEDSIDLRLLTMSAKHHAKAVAHCFQNFLRFEKDKNQTIHACNILTVNRRGKVTYSYTRGLPGHRLPKDMKMCMEQEFWKMHFKGLQLTRTHTVRFPITFQGK